MHRGAGVLEGWVALFLLALGSCWRRLATFWPELVLLTGAAGLLLVASRLREPKAEKVAKQTNNLKINSVRTIAGKGLYTHSLMREECRISPNRAMHPCI